MSLSAPSRILITGGAGFIGSNLAMHLRAQIPGAEIVCMDNLFRKGAELNVPRLEAAGVQFHRGDVSRLEEFPPGPFDCLVECSAEPSVLAGMDGDTSRLFHTNVTGAYHCLERARQWDARLVFLSTSRVYPMAVLENHPWQALESRFAWNDDGTPGISHRGVAESVSMQGARSLYGATKLAAEQLIEEYRAAYGLKAVVNRCGVVAGPWQFGRVDQGVVALWVMAHLFGRPLSYIGYGGTGKQVRDVLHVHDLCELVTEQILAFDLWEGWLGNVCGGVENSISLQELTTLCREMTGREVPVTADDRARPNDLRLFIGDCTRLFERTLWRPSRGVSRVVQDTMAWAQAHQEQLRALN